MNKFIQIISLIFITQSISFSQQIGIPSKNFDQRLREKNLSDKNKIFLSKIKECKIIEDNADKGKIVHIKKYDKNGFLIKSITFINDSCTGKVDLKFDSLGNKLVEIRYDSKDSILSSRQFKFDSFGNQIIDRFIYSHGSIDTMKYNSAGNIIEKSSIYNRDGHHKVEKYYYENDTLLIKYLLRIRKLPRSWDPRRITGVPNYIDSLYKTDDGIKETIHRLSYEENKLVKETIRIKYNRISTLISYVFENDTWQLIDTTITIDTGGLKRVIHYEYNDLGLLIFEIDSLAQREGSDDWRVTEQVFKYDELKQIIEKYEYDSRANYKKLKNSDFFEYDNNGNTTLHLSSNIDTTYYEYDIDNNLIKEKYCADKSYNCEIEYFYDKKGSLLYEERYFPNDHKRNLYRTNIKYYREYLSDSSFIQKIIIWYNEAGQRKEWMQFNNYGKLQEKISYNEFNQMNHTIVFQDNGEVLYNMIYKYDKNGNPLGQIHYDENGNIGWSKTFIYTYYD